MRKGPLAHFEEFLEGFFHKSDPAAKPVEKAPEAPAKVAPELDESLGALQNLAREMAQRLRAETDAMYVEQVDPVAVQEAASAQHKAIAADILSLHERMKTGLDRAQLEKLQTGLEPLLPYLAKEQGGVVERTYFHVMHRALRECAALAWSELEKGMQALGIRWPEPGGISPTATTAERDAARARAMEDARRAFLEAKAEHVSDRVFGLVRIWRASYPEQGSDLWLQQTLIGVASGRQLQLFERGAELVAGPEGEEIKLKLREAARENLEKVRQLMQQGSNSLSDVNEMLVATDRMCSSMAPELVWKWLEPRLNPAPVAR